MKTLFFILVSVVLISGLIFKNDIKKKTKTIETCCPTGETVCGAKCVNLEKDDSNCGLCGTKCDAPQQCENGICQVQKTKKKKECCLSGQTVCSSGCANLTSDSLNCGECGRSCPLDLPTCCDGQCSDIQTDGSNCGGCGNKCAPGAFCNAGVCKFFECPVGEVVVEGICCPTGSDVALCGGLCVPTGYFCAGPGLICLSSQILVAGTCCPTTSDAVCSGTCTSLLTDKSNCGVCSTACATIANGVSSCDIGACQYGCLQGFQDCNANIIGDGCETQISTDTNNCGGCGKVCGPYANANPTCNAGVCGFTCNVGFANCDANPSTGCETDLNTDTNNCGACGNVCVAPTPICSLGTCIA